MAFEQGFEKKAHFEQNGKWKRSIKEYKVRVCVCVCEVWQLIICVGEPLKIYAWEQWNIKKEKEKLLYVILYGLENTKDFITCSLGLAIKDSLNKERQYYITRVVW